MHSYHLLLQQAPTCSSQWAGGLQVFRSPSQNLLKLWWGVVKLMQFQYSDAKIVRNNDENKRCNEREATFIQTPLPKQGWAGGKPLQLPRRHPALSPRTTRYLRSHIPSSVTPQP